MAALRTMEDFVRQRLSVDGCRRLSVTLRTDGRFGASIVHADGRTATCEVDADPATALWNCLAPFAMRRRLPSGRDVVPSERGFLQPGHPDLQSEDIDLLADDDLDLLA